MPTLWNENVEAHRRQVRRTILDVAAGLAARHGLLNVTMSRIAEETGIGRATLYKYFASVEEILRAWHEDQIHGHLDLLTEIATREVPPFQRLAWVLEKYARIQRQRTSQSHDRHDSELVTFLHRGQDLTPAYRQLRELLRSLLGDAAAQGEIRSDTSSEELADFCLHALEGAGTLRSDAAGRRLVTLILDGLRPPG